MAPNSMSEAGTSSSGTCNTVKANKTEKGKDQQNSTGLLKDITLWIFKLELLVCSN
jgi:hypothetical protein